MLTWPLSRHFYGESSALLQPSQFFLMPQQLNFPDLSPKQIAVTCHRFDRDVAIFGPRQHGCIARLLAGGKADILSREGRAFGIGEAAGFDARWPLAKDFPGTRAIDRL